MLSKPIKKAHGRSRFTPSQEIFVANGIEALINRNEIKSSAVMKKTMVDLGKQYLLTGGHGNKVENIGQTTMYNLLQRYGVPTPSKAGKQNKSKRLSEVSKTNSVDVSVQSNPQITQAQLLELLQYHRSQLAKFEQMLEEVRLRQAQEEIFISYNTNQNKNTPANQMQESFRDICTDREEEFMQSISCNEETSSDPTFDDEYESEKDGDSFNFYS